MAKQRNAEALEELRQPGPPVIEVEHDLGVGHVANPEHAQETTATPLIAKRGPGGSDPRPPPGYSLRTRDHLCLLLSENGKAALED